MKLTGAQCRLWSNVRRSIVAALSVTLLAAMVVSFPYLIFSEPSGPVISVAEVFASESTDIEVSAPLSVSSMPRIEIVSGRIRLAPVDHTPSPNQKDLEKQIASGTTRLEIEGAKILVDLGARPGDASGPPASSRGVVEAIGEAMRALKFPSVRITNTTLAVSGSAGAPSRELIIEAVEVTRSGDQHRIKGKSKFNGHPVDFSIVLLPLTQLEGGIVALPVKAVVSNTIVSTSLIGHLTFGTEAKLVSDDMEFRVIDVPAFAHWVGLNWPLENSIKSFLAEGRLEWAGSSVAFSDASFMMDGNAATGSLTVGLRKARTFVEGTLAFDRLDVSSYANANGLPAPGDGTTEDDEGAGAATNTAFLRQLRDVDADLRISAEVFKAGDLAAKGLAATIALNGGILVADIAELQLSPGGEGIVQINVDAARDRPESRLFAKLENYDLAVVCRMLFGDAVISGPGRVVARLVGQPDSYHAFLTNMVGKIEIESETGVTADIDIPKLISRARSAGTNGGDTAVEADSLRGATRLDWLTTTLRIGTGRILADHILAYSGDTAIEARGSMHLTDGKMTFDVWAGRGETSSIFAAAIAAAGIGPAQASMHGLTGAIIEGDWVRVQGDWNRPTLSSEPILPRQNPPAPSDDSSAVGPRAAVNGSPTQGTARAAGAALDP